ncbi:MAG: AgmX/PglI C-terminal domain-containing protein [Calditrichaeota bacterium]|nr:AgmX/PglI C-terminal domain-containing protein [Calditrichota bacterium]
MKHGKGTYATGAAAWDPAPGGMPHELKELPKEFRKKLFSGVDRLFVGIVLLSLVFHVLLILYWLGHLKMPGRGPAEVAIPKPYVDLIVKRRVREELPAQGVRTPGEEILPRVLAAREPSVAAGFERATTETAGPAAESMAKGAHAAAEVRADTRAARAATVRSIGVLRLIGGAGSGAVDVAGMSTVLQSANGNVRELETVLAQLDGLTVPRGEQGGLRGGRVVTSAGNLKGGRAARPADDIAQLVGEVAPLAQVSERAVERTTSFERVQSNIAARPPAEQLRGVTRTAEQVSSIIRAHHSAIQDCYKSALRTSPDTRGEISVRLWVNPDGEVVDAEIVSSTVNNPELEECVLRKVLQWSDFGFADPERGLAVYRQTYQFGQ